MFLRGANRQELLKQEQARVFDRQPATQEDPTSDRFKTQAEAEKEALATIELEAIEARSQRSVVAAYRLQVRHRLLLSVPP